MTTKPLGYRLYSPLADEADYLYLGSFLEEYELFMFGTIVVVRTATKCMGVHHQDALPHFVADKFGSPRHAMCEAVWRFDTLRVGPEPAFGPAGADEHYLGIAWKTRGTAKHQLVDVWFHPTNLPSLRGLDTLWLRGDVFHETVTRTSAFDGAAKPDAFYRALFDRADNPAWR